MKLAMFAGENRDNWDDLLPAVMMAYRSSVHESTCFSPYRLMFGEKNVHYLWTWVSRIGIRTHRTLLKNPYALWVRDPLEVAYDQVRHNSGQAVQQQKRLYDKRAV